PIVDVMDQQRDRSAGDQRGEERNPVGHVENIVEGARVEEQEPRDGEIHGETSAHAADLDAVDRLGLPRGELATGGGGEDGYGVTVACPAAGLLEQVDFGATGLGMPETAPITRENARVWLHTWALLPVRARQWRP